MSAENRFKRLYALPGCMYLEGSPVLVQAGALLMDQTLNKCLAQLRLQNLSNQVVTGVKVAIESLDMEGLSLGVVEASYPDLTCAPGASFGDRVPMYLPNSNVRSFRLWVTTVVMEGASIWKATDRTPFAALPEAAALPLETELAQQYALEAKAAGGPDTVGGMQQAMGLWQCGCGQWNPLAHTYCHACALTLSWQKKHLEPYGLSRRLEERLAKEEIERKRQKRIRQQREEEERRREEARLKAQEAELARQAEEDARRRKKRRITIILVAILAVVITAVLVYTQVILPDQYRSQAYDLVQADRYEEARALYAKVPDGDREYQNVLYARAVALHRAGEYTKAIPLYQQTNSLFSTDRQITACYIDQALKLAGEGAYKEAWLSLEDLNAESLDGQRRTIAQARTQICTDWARALCAAGEYDNALNTLTLVEGKAKNLDGENAGAIQKTIYIAQGDAFMAAENFAAAAEAYTYANGQYDGSVRYATARLYESQGLYTKAAETYSYIRSDKTYPDAQQRYKNCLHWSLVNPKAGDKVYFGTSENKQALPWTVLAVEDDQVLLLSDWSFATKKMVPDNYKSYSWEKSDVRSYLNTEALTTFFTEEEQTLILYSKLQNSDNITTSDRLFLLSEEQVYRYLTASERKSNSGSWLRTGTADGKRVHYLDNKGAVSSTNTSYTTKDVVPAMRVVYLKDTSETLTDAAGRIMGGDYEAALKLKAEGKYADAITAFDKIITYKDSREQILSCRELLGDEAVLAGKYDSAVTYYGLAGHATKLAYAQGMVAAQSGHYAQAAQAFYQADKVFDAQSQLWEAQLTALAKAQYNDTVYLGRYPLPMAANEKNDWYSTADDEAADLIPWRVLTANAKELVLMADLPVAYRAFHDEWVNTDWPSCGLNAWLNGEFYQAAFSEGERKVIAPMQAEGQADFLTLPEGINYGELSMREMEYALGKSLPYSLYQYFREMKLTFDQGSRYTLWTRTSGESADYAKILFRSGSTVSLASRYVNEQAYVQPLLYISLDAVNQFAEEERLRIAYAQAQEKLDAGDYEAAKAAFIALIGYEDSAEKASQAQKGILAKAYNAARTLLDNQDYEGAEAAFLALEGYEDSADKAAEARDAMAADRYQAAEALWAAEDYRGAEAAFLALEGYEDSADRAEAARIAYMDMDYAAAQALLDAGDYEGAETAFTALGDYEDSAEKAQRAHDIPLEQAYAAAQALLEAEEFAAAEAAFDALGDYEDSVEKAKQAHTIPRQRTYDAAEAAFGAARYDEARELYASLGNFENAARKADYIAAEMAEDEANRQAYAAALSLEKAGDYEAAYAAYRALGDYHDSGKRAASCLINSGACSYLTAPYSGAFLFTYKGVNGYANLGTGEIVEYADCTLPVAANNANWHRYGVGIIKKDSRQGLINAQGEIIAPCKYSPIGDFVNGEAVVYKPGEGNGIMSTEGKLVTDSFKVDAIQRIAGSTVYTTGEALIINGQECYKRSFADKALVPNKNQYLRVNADGSFIWHSGVKWRYFSAQGEVLYESDQRLASAYGDVLFYQEDSLWGLINTQGEVVLKPAYATYSEFNEHGVADVLVRGKNSDKYGLINAEGKVIVKPSSDYSRGISDFGHGFFLYNNKKGSGLLNEAGKVIVKTDAYDRIDDSTEGYVAVRNIHAKTEHGYSDMAYILNRDGKVVWQDKSHGIAFSDEVPNVGYYNYDTSYYLVIINENGSVDKVSVGSRDQSIRSVTRLDDTHALVAKHSDKQGYTFYVLDLITHKLAKQAQSYDNVPAFNAEGYGAASKLHSRGWQILNLDLEPVTFTLKESKPAELRIVFPDFETVEAEQTARETVAEKEEPALPAATKEPVIHQPYVAGHATSLFINQAMLQAMGFEIPTTVEDLVQVLEWFSQNYVDMYGNSHTLAALDDEPMRAALAAGMASLDGLTPGHYGNLAYDLTDSLNTYFTDAPFTVNALLVAADYMPEDCPPGYVMFYDHPRPQTEATPTPAPTPKPTLVPTSAPTPKPSAAAAMDARLWINGRTLELVGCEVPRSAEELMMVMEFAMALGDANAILFADDGSLVADALDAMGWKDALQLCAELGVAETLDNPFEHNGLLVLAHQEPPKDAPYILLKSLTTGASQQAIVDAAYALTDGETLKNEKTLTGQITKINTPWSADYKNITVTLVCDERPDRPIECYRLTGKGAEQLAVGDVITVTGILKNYKGTIEFDKGCTLDQVVRKAPAAQPASGLSAAERQELTDKLAMLVAAGEFDPGLFREIYSQDPEYFGAFLMEMGFTMEELGL